MMFNLMPKSTFTNLFDGLMGDLENGITKYTSNPAVDIEEEDKRFVIKADLPGISRDEISISAEDGVLTIKAEKKESKKEACKGYSYCERRSGAYERSFKLTDALDAEAIDASLKDGVLTVYVPKKDKAISKKIEIR